MMLQGKTALITGGSRGIGRAICDAYYDQGATLIVMARDEAKLQEACKQIDKDNSGRVIGIACDVGNKESIDAAFVKIKEQIKSLNILVNCAGINIREPLESFSFDSWNKVMDVNLTGPFLITQACFDLMKDNGGKDCRYRFLNVSRSPAQLLVPIQLPRAASRCLPVLLLLNGLSTISKLTLLFLAILLLR